MNSKNDQQPARETQREASAESTRPRSTAQQLSPAARSLGALYMKRIIASLGDVDAHHSTAHAAPEKEAGS